MSCVFHPFCRGMRPRWMILAGLMLFAPPVCWSALLLVVPTDCARQKIEERISQATGRKVTLGRVGVGLCGGVFLSDLSVGAPHSDNDPWLRVRRATIDVNAFDLLFSRVEPSRIDVEGVEFRVLRRMDGSLELADLLRNPSKSPGAIAHEPDDDPECCLGGLDLTMRDVKVTLIDEPAKVRLELTDVEGAGTLRECVARLVELRGRLNGGPFEATALVDRSGKSPRFEGQVRMHGVSLGEGGPALVYLIPVISGIPAPLDGKLDLSLYLQGQGATREELRKTLTGRGSVKLDPVVLDGSMILNQLDDVVDLPAQGRIGAIRADVVVQDGRAASDELTIDVGRLPLILSGSTDFDGRVNYALRPDRLAERLPIQARNLLAELQIDVNDLADVRVGGTVDALCVTIDGVPANPDGPATAPQRLDDRSRLREIGRRIRDRVRR